jgi:hypothetical protein
MECAHCGRELKGCGEVEGNSVCHPDPAVDFPDCYRRITVYREPIGILKEFEDTPPGVEEPLTGWKAWSGVQEDLHSEATVCVTHMRFIPCRKEDGCLISVLPDDVERVRRYQNDAPGDHRSAG